MHKSAIAAACRKHGAKEVSDACYSAMNGRRAALEALGLGELRGIAQLHLATTVAYNLMGDEDQVADLTTATIDGAKLP